MRQGSQAVSGRVTAYTHVTGGRRERPARHVVLSTNSNRDRSELLLENRGFELELSGSTSQSIG